MGLSSVQVAKEKTCPVFNIFFKVVTSSMKFKIFVQLFTWWRFKILINMDQRSGHCNLEVKWFHDIVAVLQKFAGYHFNLDKLRCEFTGNSWFLLSGSEPSVILKISAPLKTSGFFLQHHPTSSLGDIPCAFLSVPCAAPTEKKHLREGTDRMHNALIYSISFQEKKKRMPLHLLHHKLLL